MSEELMEQTKVGDSLEVGAEYHPEHGVVTILFSSPEQSTALNLEPEKEELSKFLKALKDVGRKYENLSE